MALPTYRLRDETMLVVTSLKKPSTDFAHLTTPLGATEEAKFSEIYFGLMWNRSTVPTSKRIKEITVIFLAGVFSMDGEK